MIHRARFAPVCRWWLPVLTLLLMLGHVCELPALADLGMSWHLAEGADHAAHDRAHGPQISCDPVDVLARTGSVQVDRDLDAMPVGPRVDRLLARPVAGSLDGSARPLSRPPLFLLHASLLI